MIGAAGKEELQERPRMDKKTLLFLELTGLLQEQISRGFFDQEDIHELILLVLKVKHNTRLLHHKGNSYANCVEPDFFKLLCRFFLVFEIC